MAVVAMRYAATTVHYNDCTKQWLLGTKPTFDSMECTRMFLRDL